MKQRRFRVSILTRRFATQAIDGPFTETKEYIGGVSIIKASDLDAALAWGRKLAIATTLPIEVRPFREENH